MPRPLRNRDFRRLLAGRTSIYLGNAIAPVALAFAVLDGLGSIVDLGLVVACRSVANVVLLLFGGVLADRFPRRYVVTGSSLLACASQGLLAFSVLSGLASVPWLAGLSLLNGAASATALPAVSALLPQTVDSDVLRPANAVARIGSTSAMLVGASGGGVLVAAASPGWALVVNAASFALAAGCFARVRAVSPMAASSSVWVELRAGWFEVRARRWVWAVVAQFFVVNAMIAGGVQVLGPKIAQATIGRGAWGVVLAIQMLGALAGGMLAARWSPRRALLFGCALVALEAVPIVALAVSPVIWVLATTMFLSGLAIEQFAVAWETSLQENIPPERLARVYSYDALGSFLAVPVGEVLVGPLAEAVGARLALFAMAGCVLLATVAVVAVPDVRRLYRPAFRRGASE